MKRYSLEVAAFAESPSGEWVRWVDAQKLMRVVGRVIALAELHGHPTREAWGRLVEDAMAAELQTAKGASNG